MAGPTSLGERIVVVGDSCTGKSTLGERLARLVAAPHVELDALYWKPGWTPSPPDEFLPRVDAATRGTRWVLSGNYGEQRHVSWPRADTVVWLDFPLHVTIPRIVTRSWRRWRRDELLWGTNRERFWPQLKVWSPPDSLIAWTLSHHHKLRARYEAARTDSALAHLRWYRLRSSRELAQWSGRVGLDSASRAAAGSRGSATG
ncbi:MAG TPA: adenylate kinase [Myxococcota bacterium]|nr:adenylate kinase [Myxococcota bacterium]